ncbi:MAG: phosphate ABC transporter substrate-binding protein [Candidatus Omnitrophica bacterium]|nr:phosphate ABC transporter substrate-binding protein [Candidatus Omnitrophota bacterium]
MIRKQTVSLLLFLIFLSTTAQAGKLSYKGSSTIGEHIMPKASEAFAARTGVRFASIDIPGSGEGLAALLKGEVDLAGVSRPLSYEEKKRGFYYQVIGYDAIGVFVHRSNPVQSLGKEQIKRMFTGEIKNWSETSGGDAPVVCVTETWGKGRATTEEFRRLVMGQESYRADRKEVDRPRDQAAALASEENGIAAASIAFARPEIRAVAIEGVSPEPANVVSGAYLLSRPLLLVTKGLPRGEAKEFLDFILSEKGQALVAERFVSVREIAEVKRTGRGSADGG